MSKNVKSLDEHNILSLEELLKIVQDDKNCRGVTSFQRDRYPLRFVLFDNFGDCFSFVDKLTSENSEIKLEGIDSWLDSDLPDVLITHYSLSQKISDFIANSDAKLDYIIAPFSEIARFYNNNEPNRVFESIIKTIKAIQSSGIASKLHQRFYIPIVGLDAKMESFLPDDTMIKIWHLKNNSNTFSHKLILAKETYGVRDINYPIVRTMKDWLSFWKNAEINNSETIICTSPSILANASYAQPDNAFDYETCENAYTFLTKGLNLIFPKVIFKEKEEHLWKELASKISYSKSFNFEIFAQEYLSIGQKLTHEGFLDTWFGKSKELDRWLLVMYYCHMHNDYLSSILNRLSSFTNSDLIRTIALDFPAETNDINIRRNCLNIIAKNGWGLPTDDVEKSLRDKLISLSRARGYSYAIQYVTSLSNQEKYLLVNWIANKNITLDSIKEVFPDLFFYLQNEIPNDHEIDWLEKYFETYKNAKIKNEYTPELMKLISSINDSEVSFYKWYNKFPTTRTEIEEDIDVIYWIDGLGVDWIPFVSNCIMKYSHDSMYLNHVTIARSLLPTTTENNKIDLQKLPNFDLLKNKIGDLDKSAHEVSKYPNYIIKEIHTVRNIIEDIVKKHAGKKIAIISDHGMTWMAQKFDGLNLEGIDPNHYGRVAIRTGGKLVKDNNYIVLEDQKTYCSLSHKSLSKKTPEGVGTHGGCTPEEVLVPIFLVSSKKLERKWRAEICDAYLSNNQNLRFRIENAPFGCDIFIKYNNKRYNLVKASKNEYKTLSLNLVANQKDVYLHVGDEEQKFSINFALAADSDEDFFNI